MAETASEQRSFPLPQMIAAGLVGLGIALGMFVDMGYMVLAAVGAFGPGMLREMGWLDDKDEFQRRAAHRAGYLAYLTGGFTAVSVVAIRNLGAANLEAPGSEWVELVLVVLWLTWLFSSMLSYWGPEKTAARVLVVFGSFWGLFVIGGHLTEPAELPLLVLPVAPFFILAWMAGRWARVTGALLLSLSAFIFWYIFDLGRAFIEWPSQILTFALLVVPLVACGIALLPAQVDEEEDEAPEG